MYISNFLTGLVFWYGVEKLFMKSIGIDAVGVGVATAFLSIFCLLFDIPAGIIADRWSRKGMLMLSAGSLAICAIVLGVSTSLPMYILGYLFYGINVVATSGTYQAIIYDILHEEGRTESYSKIRGRAYGLFLVGAGVANVASGFVVARFGLRSVFFITIVSCIANFIVLSGVTEPVFHKADNKEQTFSQMKHASKAIARLKVLRALTIVLTVFAVSEMFKQDFGQLYMLRYVSAPQVIGLLWAAYAFTWGLGSMIAHRFKARLSLVIWAAVVPLVLMCFIDTSLSLIIFMFQAVAAAAMINLIDTRIQDATPSNVRASIMSVVSSLGRVIAIPSSFVIGWLIRDYGALWALRFVTLLVVLVFVYYLIASRNDESPNGMEAIGIVETPTPNI
jgi:MFS family permease